MRATEKYLDGVLNLQRPHLDKQQFHSPEEEDRVKQQSAEVAVFVAGYLQFLDDYADVSQPDFLVGDENNGTTSTRRTTVLLHPRASVALDAVAKAKSSSARQSVVQNLSRETIAALSSVQQLRDPEVQPLVASYLEHLQKAHSDLVFENEDLLRRLHRRGDSYRFCPSALANRVGLLKYDEDTHASDDEGAKAMQLEKHDKMHLLKSRKTHVETRKRHRQSSNLEEDPEVIAAKPPLKIPKREELWGKLRHSVRGTKRGPYFTKLPPPPSKQGSKASIASIASLAASPVSSKATTIAGGDAGPQKHAAHDVKALLDRHQDLYALRERVGIQGVSKMLAQVQNNLKQGFYSRQMTLVNFAPEEVQEKVKTALQVLAHGLEKSDSAASISVLAEEEITPPTGEPKAPEVKVEAATVSPPAVAATVSAPPRPVAVPVVQPQVVSTTLPKQESRTSTPRDELSMTQAAPLVQPIVDALQKEESNTRPQVQSDTEEIQQDELQQPPAAVVTVAAPDQVVQHGFPVQEPKKEEPPKIKTPALSHTEDVPPKKTETTPQPAAAAPIAAKIVEKEKAPAVQAPPLLAVDNSQNEQKASTSAATLQGPAASVQPLKAAAVVPSSQDATAGKEPERPTETLVSDVEMPDANPGVVPPVVPKETDEAPAPAPAPAAITSKPAAAILPAKTEEPKTSSSATEATKLPVATFDMSTPRGPGEGNKVIAMSISTPRVVETHDIATPLGPTDGNVVEMNIATPISVLSKDVSSSAAVNEKDEGIKIEVIEQPQIKVENAPVIVMTMNGRTLSGESAMEKRTPVAAEAVEGVPSKLSVDVVPSKASMPSKATTEQAQNASTKAEDLDEDVFMMPVSQIGVDPTPVVATPIEQEPVPMELTSVLEVVDATSVAAPKQGEAAKPAASSGAVVPVVAAKSGTSGATSPSIAGASSYAASKSLAKSSGATSPSIAGATSYAASKAATTAASSAASAVVLGKPPAAAAASPTIAGAGSYAASKAAAAAKNNNSNAAVKAEFLAKRIQAMAAKAPPADTTKSDEKPMVETKGKGKASNFPAPAAASVVAAKASVQQPPKQDAAPQAASSATATSVAQEIKADVVKAAGAVEQALERTFTYPAIATARNDEVVSMDIVPESAAQREQASSSHYGAPLAFGASEVTSVLEEYKSFFEVLEQEDTTLADEEAAAPIAAPSLLETIPYELLPSACANYLRLGDMTALVQERLAAPVAASTVARKYAQTQQPCLLGTLSYELLPSSCANYLKLGDMTAYVQQQSGTPKASDMTIRNEKQRPYLLDRLPYDLLPSAKANYLVLVDMSLAEAAAKIQAMQNIDVKESLSLANLQQKILVLAPLDDLPFDLLPSVRANFVRLGLQRHDEVASAAQEPELALCALDDLPFDLLPSTRANFVRLGLQKEIIGGAHSSGKTTPRTVMVRKKFVPCLLDRLPFDLLPSVRSNFLQLGSSEAHTNTPRHEAHKKPRHHILANHHHQHHKREHHQHHPAASKSPSTAAQPALLDRVPFDLLPSMRANFVFCGKMEPVEKPVSAVSSLPFYLLPSVRANFLNLDKQQTAPKSVKIAEPLSIGESKISSASLGSADSTKLRETAFPQRNYIDPSDGGFFQDGDESLVGVLPRAPQVTRHFAESRLHISYADRAHVRLQKGLDLQQEHEQDLRELAELMGLRVDELRGSHQLNFGASSAAGPEYDNVSEQLHHEDLHDRPLFEADVEHMRRSQRLLVNAQKVAEDHGMTVEEVLKEQEETPQVEQEQLEADFRRRSKTLPLRLDAEDEDHDEQLSDVASRFPQMMLQLAVLHNMVSTELDQRGSPSAGSKGMLNSVAGSAELPEGGEDITKGSSSAQFRKTVNVKLLRQSLSRIDDDEIDRELAVRMAKLRLQSTLGEVVELGDASGGEKQVVSDKSPRDHGAAQQEDTTNQLQQDLEKMEDEVLTAKTLVEELMKDADQLVEHQDDMSELIHTSAQLGEELKLRLDQDDPEDAQDFRALADRSRALCRSALNPWHRAYHLLKMIRVVQSGALKGSTTSPTATGVTSTTLGSNLTTADSSPVSRGTADLEDDLGSYQPLRGGSGPGRFSSSFEPALRAPLLEAEGESAGAPVDEEVTGVEEKDSTEVFEVVETQPAEVDKNPTASDADHAVKLSSTSAVAIKQEVEVVDDTTQQEQQEDVDYTENHRSRPLTIDEVYKAPNNGAAEPFFYQPTEGQPTESDRPFYTHTPRSDVDVGHHLGNDQHSSDRKKATPEGEAVEDEGREAPFGTAASQVENPEEDEDDVDALLKAAEEVMEAVDEDISGVVAVVPVDQAEFDATPDHPAAIDSFIYRTKDDEDITPAVAPAEDEEKAIAAAVAAPAIAPEGESIDALIAAAEEETEIVDAELGIAPENESLDEILAAAEEAAEAVDADIAEAEPVPAQDEEPAVIDAFIYRGPNEDVANAEAVLAQDEENDEDLDAILAAAEEVTAAADEDIADDTPAATGASTIQQPPMSFYPESESTMDCEPRVPPEVDAFIYHRLPPPVIDAFIYRDDTGVDDESDVGVELGEQEAAAAESEDDDLASSSYLEEVGIGSEVEIAADDAVEINNYFSEGDVRTVREQAGSFHQGVERRAKRNQDSIPTYRVRGRTAARTQHELNHVSQRVRSLSAPLMFYDEGEDEKSDAGLKTSSEGEAELELPHSKPHARHGGWEHSQADKQSQSTSTLRAPTEKRPTSESRRSRSRDDFSPLSKASVISADIAECVPKTPLRGSDASRYSDYHRPYVIGVCGATCSGKTTVCDIIRDSLKGVSRVAFMPSDSYYKDLNEEKKQKAARGEYDFDHPDALSWDELHADLVTLKRGDRRVRLPCYDFRTHSRIPLPPLQDNFAQLQDQTEPVRPSGTAGGAVLEPADVIIVEGILIYAASADIRDEMDMKIFIDSDSDIRLARRLERDITHRGRDFSGVMQQYLRFVRPSYRNFVEPSKQFADIIIPNNGQEMDGIRKNCAVRMIVQHIKMQLAARDRFRRTQTDQNLAEHLRLRIAEAPLSKSSDGAEERSLRTTTT
ncbi:unnamed protein product [Amoebophrya sp. A120]|nr:unnamed protein product [Amoebophrya sp. A120]|eukprot:GSA120T00003451001.1